MSTDTDTNQSSQSTIGVSSIGLSPALMDFMINGNIQPGSNPSYQVCKTIFTHHPLGAKMAQDPVNLAQSQKREIEIPGAPETELKKAFWQEWEKLGQIGADNIINNLMTLSRVYGIATLAMGVRKSTEESVDPSKEIPLGKLWELDLYFNVLDPLNTAGSLVLNQDPTSPHFMKPREVRVGSQTYHPANTLVVMNEMPIWISFTDSAFGFVGRSVYQRAVYPLKSYLQSLLTDQAVQEKAMLLVAKFKQPGSVVDQMARKFFAMKRTAIQGAKTGNVVSMGPEDSLESIDLRNLHDAAELSRNNILKNIAAASCMPASMINMETLAEGFGEGSEDAKNIARYIDRIRLEMIPAYRFMDEVVMRRAWNPPFYMAIQAKYPDDYEGIEYETAFLGWKNAFVAIWPNLLAEPDSEKVKVEDTILKATIAIAEVILPAVDPENKARVIEWVSDVINDRKFSFSSPLILDAEAIAQFTPPLPMETERVKKQAPQVVEN